MRSLIRVLLFAIVATTVAAQGPQPIPAGAERAYIAVKDRVDGNAAMDIVRFMDAYWRISGNPGFNASVDRIRDGLQSAGVACPGRRAAMWAHEDTGVDILLDLTGVPCVP